MKSTVNSMQFNYYRHKMARNKSLLRYQKYPSAMNFSVLSDNVKRQKSEKKTHHFLTQWLSSIAIPIKALPNDGLFKI